ncbi:MAG: HD-GYP domain-containing protein [Bacillota bacterium]
MPEKILEVNVAELMPGDVLASDIFSPSGGILVKKDTRITMNIIEGLRKNYNESIYVYRKLDDTKKSIHININDIIIKECEDIINVCINKFIKKSKNTDEIKKTVLETVRNTRVLELLFLLRALGDNSFKHSISVAVYSVAIGIELHFQQHRLNTLSTAAVLHDIGMVKVGREILNKDDSLTEKEKDIIKNHPKYGFDILNESGWFNAEISNVVLQHHERYDGTGYPNKISNEKIHIMSKIIGVCDVYEALTSDRPYRKKFRKSDTIEYLLGTGDFYFNHEIIQALINSIVIYPFGQWVEMSTGEVGIVVEEEEKTIFNIRPKVMVYFDSKGRKLDIPRVLDLSSRENSNILIERTI